MNDLAGQRRRARARALEILYEAAIKGRPVGDVLPELALSPDPYTVRLLDAVELNESRATALVAAHTQGWAIDRLALVDRLIMTMSIGELLMVDRPPIAVVLNEAVELARTFSTDDSPAFVNGVLSACVAELSLD